MNFILFILRFFKVVLGLTKTPYTVTQKNGKHKVIIDFRAEVLAGDMLRMTFQDAKKTAKHYNNLPK